MWYFIWILAVFLSLGSGLLATLWVEVRSRTDTIAEEIRPSRADEAQHHLTDTAA